MSEEESLERLVKKDVSRLRSEVRKLKDTSNQIGMFNPFAGVGVTDTNFWALQGYPWVSESGRKAVLTEWFWQPIRGQPRRVDTNELRQFSQTFWVHSCIATILDEVSSLEWDIIPDEEIEYEDVEDEINYVKKWLKYPNKNGETFNELLRALIKDILELDAGVLVKVFTMESYDWDTFEETSGAPILKPLGQRELTELYVRDGASFLKEVDKFGFRFGYWQYSYQIPAHPMWFNDSEITYVSKNPRSMSPYGYAPTQAILDIIKSLHYSTLYNKRYFEESPIPDGALSMLDTNQVEMQNFINWWNTEFVGSPHKLAIINKDLKWQPFNVSQRELEFLETQEWYYKMVIAAFGLTPSELGLTEDLNKATSATQAELSKRKGIRPLLKVLENAINQDVIPEFGYEGIKFAFIYDDPAEKAMKLNNWKIELDMGIKTINEVRVELGLEPVGWGDVPKAQALNPFGMMGFGQPNNSNEEGAQSNVEDSQDTGEEERINEGEEEKTEKGKKKEKALKRKCPYCGKETLVVVSSADDTGGVTQYQCQNCGLSIDGNRAVMPTYKSSKLEKADIDMDLKEYTNYDITKFANDISRFAGSPEYKDLLKRYLEDLTQKERDRIALIIQNGIKKGDTVRMVSEKIKKVIKNKIRAELIARTEVIRITNEANRIRLKNAGATIVEWIASPEDGRLCERCKKRDGRHYSIDEIHNQIPLHPRCRCTFGAVG